MAGSKGVKESHTSTNSQIYYIKLLLTHLQYSKWKILEVSWVINISSHPPAWSLWKNTRLDIMHSTAFFFLLSNRRCLTGVCTCGEACLRLLMCLGTLVKLLGNNWCLLSGCPLSISLKENRKIHNICSKTKKAIHISCILPEARPTSRRPAAWLPWHSAQACLGPTLPNQDTNLTEYKQGD